MAVTNLCKASDSAAARRVPNIVPKYHGAARRRPGACEVLGSCAKGARRHAVLTPDSITTFIRPSIILWDMPSSSSGSYRRPMNGVPTPRVDPGRGPVLGRHTGHTYVYDSVAWVPL